VVGLLPERALFVVITADARGPHRQNPGDDPTCGRRDDNADCGRD
jgi:hypothetical protein